MNPELLMMDYMSWEKPCGISTVNTVDFMLFIKRMLRLGFGILKSKIHLQNMHVYQCNCGQKINVCFRQKKCLKILVLKEYIFLGSRKNIDYPNWYCTFSVTLCHSG